MSSTRIKEKLSSLVLSQLPEFIQSDYSTFVAFLEAYYEFLEQDQNAQELLQNARSYNDVDRTIDSFVEYFQRQYSNDIPRNALADKKTLIKNIKDLYENRGNSKSYKLLFKILFNKDVDIFYPNTQVLRASDGKWVQNYSIFVRVITGDITSVIQKTSLISSDTTQYPLLIKKVRKAITARGESDNVYECFFDNSKNVPIELGNFIEYGSFRGVVESVPTIAQIIKPGAGFKVGDILPLVSGLGNYAKVKVIKVTSTGGIAGVQFINYGAGYSGEFFNFFSAATGTAITSSFEYDEPGGTITVRDSTGGFIETGTVITPTYAVPGFFAEDYAGTVIREFYNSTDITSTGVNQELGSQTISVGDDNDAVLYIKLGTKTKYPGYYESIDGFLSDDIFLENEEYYQPFTYVLKIDERVDAYRKAVLDILHPAGTKLLGELTLGADIDLSTTITATIRFLISRFQDIAGTNDDGNAKDILKPVDDPTASTAEFIAKDIIKPREDNVEEILDSTAYLLAKPLAHESNVLETNQKDIIKVIGLGENLPYAAEDYFAEDYTEITGTNFIVILETFFEAVLGRTLEDIFTVEESAAIGYTSNITDATVSTSDDGSTQNVTKNLSDDLGAIKVDFDISGTLSYFTDFELISDTSVVSYLDKYSEIEQVVDSGSIFTTDYADFTYFAEDYVGTTLHTF